MLIGGYLQTVELVLQQVDGFQCFVVVVGNVSHDEQRLFVVADGLLDGGVDAGKTLDGGVSQKFAVGDLLIEPCGRSRGVSLELLEVSEKTKSLFRRSVYLSGCSGRRPAPRCCC